MSEEEYGGGGGDLSGELGKWRRLSLSLKIIVTFAIYLLCSSVERQNRERQNRESREEYIKWHISTLQAISCCTCCCLTGLL